MGAQGCGCGGFDHYGTHGVFVEGTKGYLIAHRLEVSLFPGGDEDGPRPGLGGFTDLGQECFRRLVQPLAVLDDQGNGSCVPGRHQLDERIRRPGRPKLGVDGRSRLVVFDLYVDHITDQGKGPDQVGSLIAYHLRQPITHLGLTGSVDTHSPSQGIAERPVGVVGSGRLCLDRQGVHSRTAVEHFGDQPTLSHPGVACDGHHAPAANPCARVHYPDEHLELCFPAGERQLR